MRQLTTKLNRISFEKWQDSVTEDGFSLFIEAILLCNLRDSLEFVNIHDWAADIKMIIGQLRGNGLGNIKVQNNEISPHLVKVSANKVFYD